MYIQKKCATCSIAINGRKDKIFCSKECQNKHHKIAREETSCIQKSKIEPSIKRNYIVLRGLMGTSTKVVHIHRDTLLKYGFNIYHCLKRLRRRGKLYFVIKEFEFRYIGKGRVEVRRTSKSSIYSIQFLDRWKREFNGNQSICEIDGACLEEVNGRSKYVILQFNSSLGLATNVLNLLAFKEKGINRMI